MYFIDRETDQTPQALKVPKQVPERIKESNSTKSPELRKSFSDNKLSLQDCIMKDFLYSELFEIKKGKRIVISKLTESGDCPFVSSIDKNNGVSRRLNIEPNQSGNTITVNYNGSIGEAFYQPVPFWASDDVNVLYPKFKLNVYIAMFLITMIKKERYRFNYGRKWHAERMENSIIRLPVTAEGDPDWNFMERFIKGLPYSKFLDSVNGINKLRKSFSDNKLSLQDCIMKDFLYSELFEIKKGKRIVISKQIEKGNCPFVSSINKNNGISDWLNIEPNQSGNTITVNYDGSVGEAFYQPKPYWALDSVNVLYPKFKLNVYIAMFLITLIKKERYRYNYGRKWHVERMEKSTIRLPVTASGNPDWNFMENFIKGLPYSKFLDSVNETTTISKTNENTAHNKKLQKTLVDFESSI